MNVHTHMYHHATTHTHTQNLPFTQLSQFTHSHVDDGFWNMLSTYSTECDTKTKMGKQISLLWLCRWWNWRGFSESIAYVYCVHITMQRDNNLENGESCPIVWMWERYIRLSTASHPRQVKQYLSFWLRVCLQFAEWKRGGQIHISTQSHRGRSIAILHKLFSSHMKMNKGHINAAEVRWEVALS